jgi:hypothetical protein
VECLTFEWFTRLANDTRVIQGLEFTAVHRGVRGGPLAVFGLAGALLLTQIFPARPAAYYTIVTSPS